MDSAPVTSSPAAGPVTFSQVFGQQCQLMEADTAAQYSAQKLIRRNPLYTEEEFLHMLEWRKGIESSPEKVREEQEPSEVGVKCLQGRKSKGEGGDPQSPTMQKGRGDIVASASTSFLASCAQEPQEDESLSETVSFSLPPRERKLELLRMEREDLLLSEWFLANLYYFKFCAVESLHSLNDQISHFIVKKSKTLEEDEDAFLPSEKESLKSSMMLMRHLLMDAQDFISVGMVLISLWHIFHQAIDPKPPVLMLFRCHGEH
ncbi:hypothetical protein DUI87_31934 [Hirundo rustica rustica]|uniref:Uncharacterized protein n=1 Tax=Hirundo rustica rustica TaxID=333673 RepID=A0A3M0IS79_HIRRU|nr:hypothetical protein DUI87_31934 [Hirundo rustica rustica]